MPSPALGERGEDGGGSEAYEGPSSLTIRALERAQSLGARWALTPRQTAVLAHVATGETNRRIAAALSCAESTVEQHVTALLEKAGCNSRVELVARFWAD
jgi:DNA-binding NarL/FixJ family response regulator